MPTKLRQPSINRRGAMLPLIAVLLPVLVLFLGFAVDLAYMQLARVELQAVTDAAARAGAATLSKTDNRVQARQAAKQIANRNRVAGKSLKLTNADIEFGRSEKGADGRYAFQVGNQPYNAVRVTGDRSVTSNTGAISLFFGSMVGVLDFEPQFVTTASFLNVDICLVLDRSTSMKSDVGAVESGMYSNDPRFCKPPGADTRWVALDGAVKVFTATLRESKAVEQVALVSYSTAEPQYVGKYCGFSNQAATIDLSLSENLDAVDARVTQLTNGVWNGNTDIESGMRAGLNVLQNDGGLRESADKMMIVMTDGNETVGSALSAAAACDSAKVQVHTITFGADANQGMMASIATQCSGRHLHADTEEELAAAFRELAAQAAQLTE